VLYPKVHWQALSENVTERILEISGAESRFRVPPSGGMWFHQSKLKLKL
jgi:hypothetical protein